MFEGRKTLPPFPPDRRARPHAHTPKQVHRSKFHTGHACAHNHTTHCAQQRHIPATQALIHCCTHTSVHRTYIHAAQAEHAEVGEVGAGRQPPPMPQRVHALQDHGRSTVTRKAEHQRVEPRRQRHLKGHKPPRTQPVALRTVALLTVAHRPEARHPQRLVPATSGIAPRGTPHRQWPRSLSTATSATHLAQHEVSRKQDLHRTRAKIRREARATYRPTPRMCFTAAKLVRTRG